MWLNLTTFLRAFLLVSFGLWSGGLLLRAQAPLVEDQLLPRAAEDSVLLGWKFQSAERALESGLSRVTEEQYRRILAHETLTANEADAVNIRLSVALIVQQRYQAARLVLEQVSEAGRDSAYYLYAAVATYGDGQLVDATRFNALLRSIQLTELAGGDVPWFYVLRGLQAELAGELESVLPAFERAATAAQVSEAQQAFFDSLVLRQKLRLSPSSDALAADVRSQLRRFEGEAAAYAYAREYAVILYNQGRIKEAVDVIDAERANRELGVQEREQLLLLKGMILGSNAAEGQEALQELLRSGQNRDVLRVALQVLSQNWTGASESLAAFLNELVARAQPHPLLGQIYYLRSQLSLAQAEAALERGDVEFAREAISLAEAAARYMLEQFPGLDQITNVYRLLAYAALQRTPPQYRAAADFLTQLRDQTENVNERSALNQLIGDSYFLNADYVNAVDFYEAARSQGMATESDGELFLRLITAKLRAGQTDSALQRIDEIDFSASINSTDRWRAEWNIAQALRSAGQLEQALQRVRSLLASSTNGNVPTALDLRLRWMEAYLSFIAGDVSDLQSRVEALLARLNSLPPEALEVGDAKLLTTELLLLKARVLIAGGDAIGGMVVLKQIRTDSPSSSAAQRSYLVESEYQASIGDLKATQETLSLMASSYPASVLAPQAIFEAALYCEQRGTDFYPEAVRLHNEIALKYPQDELVFSARLKQGDLLRKMNDFAGAQLLYENVINSYPRHPRRYIAELSRADCVLALAKNNDSQLADVALDLERIIDTPSLPVDFQAEVGYKWGFALNKRGKVSEAQEVYTLMIGSLLLDQEAAARLGASGRYWVSRMLLAMAEDLERSGAATEARRVYRKMVAFNLPGRNLAQDRAERLQIDPPADAESLLRDK